MFQASKEVMCGATALCLSVVLGGPILLGKENTMAIVENQHAAEIPWRAGYRRFTLAGPEQGVACSASLSVIEPGAGAPTHFHNTADEVIIVLDGALEMWIGDERRIVGANHTVSLPAGVPHGFVAVGRARREFSRSCRNRAKPSRRPMSMAARRKAPSGAEGSQPRRRALSLHSSSPRRSSRATRSGSAIRSPTT
jgi:quercetin dioxygenase-like cupin family protein